MSVDEVRPTRRRSPARVAKFEDERKAIMRAAYELIGSGPSAVSVDNILREAGLSTRAFYRHFESKDQLILEMYVEDSTRMAASLDLAMRRARTPATALKAWINGYMAVGYEPKRFAHAKALASYEASSAAGYAEVMQLQTRLIMQGLVALLEEAQRSGDFPDADPQADAFAVVAVCQRYLYFLFTGALDMSRPRLVNRIHGLFLRALLPKDAPPAV